MTTPVAANFTLLSTPPNAFVTPPGSSSVVRRVKLFAATHPGFADAAQAVQLSAIRIAP